MGMSFKCVLCLVLILLLSFLSGCSKEAMTTELKTDQAAIRPQSARFVTTTISMGLGKLSITGGATDLMNAVFTYNRPDWKPEVSYQVNGDRGELSVKQPSAREKTLTRNNRYEWDIKLNDKMPMDLNLNIGVGEHTLKLGTLSLNSVDIKTAVGTCVIDFSGKPSVNSLNIEGGVGDTVLDLSGKWEKSLNATIRGGVGKINVAVPEKTGTRVEVETGIGKVNAAGMKKDGNAYINESYGKTKNTISIKITAGTGDIELVTR